jgi:hypothetical protein
MSLFSRLFARSTRKPSRTNYQLQPHRRNHRRQLKLESLESRQMLTFSPAIDFPVGIAPQAVVAADFNNDGRLDLATASPGFHSVSVVLGDGAGGFGEPKIKSAGTNNSYLEGTLTVADFNNDGRLDLVTAMYGYYEYSTFGRLDVWLGNGDGTFQSPTLIEAEGLAPLAVAAGDFNNDGYSDLVGTFDLDGQSGFVKVLAGNGLGGFVTTGVAYLYPSTELAVGDLNGDGNLDAVVTATGPFASVFLGNGAGGLIPEESLAISSTSYFRNITVGDFTGDGILDLVNAGGGVEIFTGIGDGTFDGPIVHPANSSGLTGVAVADFNGDGLLDLVTSDTDTGTVTEWLGNGNGTLAEAGGYAVGLSPWAIAVGDFNGDGRPDVATANAGSNTVSVLLNDGDWTPPPPPPPPPPAMRIGDRTVTEGNAGTASATFTVTLSAPSSQPITVAYSTGNGSATAGSDYQAISGTLTFAPGETTKTINVPVVGDRLPEPNESFVVNLSGATNATIVDGQGVGTIVDDEPRIAISDVTKSEGKSKQTTLFTFTVTLSAAYDQAVTMSFATVNGTATTGNNDYVAKSGTLTFAPGETTKTITIEVKGDSKKEADEYFYLDLFGNSSNSLFTKKRGVGKILNDD